MYNKTKRKPRPMRDVTVELYRKGSLSGEYLRSYLKTTTIIDCRF